MKAKKTIVVTVILFSLLATSCGAVSVQNPLSGNGYSQFNRDLPQTISGAYNLFSLFQKSTFSNSFPYIPENKVISKTEAIAIAKDYCNIDISLQTTANLQRIYSLNDPEAPIWEVTIKGRQKSGTGLSRVITRVVKIDGYTGSIVSVN
jgi:hypothetical protein